jgi:hypothetical protein
LDSYRKPREEIGEMKQIEIKSQKHGNFIAIVDDEDFERVSKYHWRIERGRTTDYAITQLDNRVTLRMHQVVLGVQTKVGKERAESIDHIDHDGLNNRKANLRISTLGNSRNARLSKRNTTGFKGVCFHRESQRFRARIRVNYKLINIGAFTDPKVAAAAYNREAEKHFGEYAVLNKL